MAITAAMPRAVVLGVGNVLFSDEGLGPQAITELERSFAAPPRLALIDGGTSAMELLDDMANADLLLIVDAVAHGAAPGSLVVLEGEQVPLFFTRRLSPHQVGLSDVLATLALADESPRETVIIGVEPASLAMGMDLSPTVAATLPAVIDAVRDRLLRFGLPLPARRPVATVAA
jgi:hydrogenase maturation protease